MSEITLFAVHDALVTNFDYGPHPSLMMARALHWKNPKENPHPERTSFGEVEFVDNNLHLGSITLYADHKQALAEAFKKSIPSLNPYQFEKLAPVYELKLRVYSARQVGGIQLKDIWLGTRTVKISSTALLFVRFISFAMGGPARDNLSFIQAAYLLFSEQKQASERQNIDQQSQAKADPPIKAENINQDNQPAQEKV